MGKVTRFMLWMDLILTEGAGSSSFTHNMMCDAVESRYDVKLVRAAPDSRIDKTTEANATLMLDYLKVLEEEEQIG